MAETATIELAETTDVIEEAADTESAHLEDFNPKDWQFDEKSLNIYAKEAADIPLLSRKQEQRLGRAIVRAGRQKAELEAQLQALSEEKPEGWEEEREELQQKWEETAAYHQELIKELVRRNLRLVIEIALKYKNRVKGYMTANELIQEGNIGLMKAAEKFNPDHGENGSRFSTYAVWWIRRDILRAIANQTRIIRLPAHVVDEELKKISKAIAKLREQEEPVTFASLQEHTGYSKKKLQRILRASKIKDGISSLSALLSQEEGERGGALKDHIAITVKSPEDDAVLSELRAMLEELFKTMKPREVEVLKYRFGWYGEIPTREELGKEFGIGGERVRQIEKKALLKLKHPSRSKQLEEFQGVG